MDRKSCTYCNRKGLLIYPVRYAVACPAGAKGVPGLSENFRIVDAPQDIGAAKYALRALRPGYLYTYDEKRRLLKGYVVMARGHLWNFPIELPAPDVSRTMMSCLDHVEVTLSFCVDVRHSENDSAGNFWIGWSNSSWTADLIKLTADTAWRRKHMQCIDVGAMLAGGAAHCGEFQSTHTVVSHFAADVKAMQKAFGFSNTTITHEIRQRRWAPDMITAFNSHSTTQHGYIVAVNDPVGITNDLSELTVPTGSNGFDENVYRGKIIDDLLTETERSVRAHAKAKFAEEHRPVPLKKTIAYKSNFRSFGERIRDIVVDEAGAEKAYELQRKKFEAARQQTEQAVMDSAWAELTTRDGSPLLDESRRKALPAQYDKALKAFEPIASKLAQAHSQWLTSGQLASWMEGVHDPKDLSSGFAFRESLAQCIGKGAATVVCQAQLTRWLNSPNTADTRNLYMRALLFNHNQIADAAQASVGGGDIKLEHVFSIYQGALARLKKGDEAKLVDHLVLATANVLMKALTHAGTAVMKNAALVGLSLLARTTIRPSNLSARDLRDWARTQAEQQGIRLTTNRSQTRAEGLGEARRVVPRVPPDAGICAYELDVLRLEQEGRIAPGVLREVRIPGFDLTKKWFSSADFNLASVSTVLQSVALYFALSEYKNADRFDSSSTGYSAIVASLSLTAAVVETVASAVEKAPAHPLSVYLSEQWSFTTNSAKKVIPVAKKAALFAGVISGFIDIFSGIMAWHSGERALGGLYIASGAIGITLAIAAYSVGAAFFWPAFVAAIAVAIVLSLYKNTMLKKWITRCYYAKDASSQPFAMYPTLDDELTAFDSALGGA